MFSRFFLNLLFANVIFSSNVVAAPNDKVIVDKAILLSNEHPNFMRELILESASEIKNEIRKGTSTDWRKASLISNFSHEVEKEIASNPKSALKKIDFILTAGDTWRKDLNNWNKFVLIDEGQALLARWFLSGKDVDQQQAAAKFTQADETAEIDDKGHAVYMHRAAYETLAGIARESGRTKEEQIQLIKTGIHLNLEGRKKYPKYNFGVSTDALFGKFKLVTGGVAVRDYLNEWLAYLQLQPEDKQGISGSSIAGALFDEGRDDEGAAWVDSWIAHQKKLVSSPSIGQYKQSITADACSPIGSLYLNYDSIRKRNPLLLQTLHKNLNPWQRSQNMLISHLKSTT